LLAPVHDGLSMFTANICQFKPPSFVMNHNAFPSYFIRGHTRLSTCILKTTHR